MRDRLKVPCNSLCHQRVSIASTWIFFGLIVSLALFGIPHELRAQVHNCELNNDYALSNGCGGDDFGPSNDRFDTTRQEEAPRMKEKRRDDFLRSRSVCIRNAKQWLREQLKGSCKRSKQCVKDVRRKYTKGLTWCNKNSN